MRARDFDTEEEYLDAIADERADARREAQQDAFLDDPHTVRCQDCGEPWNLGYRPATRTDPAYAEQSECPRCGGQPEESR